MNVATKSINVIILASALFWMFLYVLVPASGSRGTTLFFTTISGVIALGAVGYYYTKNGFFSSKLSIFMMGVFLFRIIFGVLHYQIAFNDDYFNSQEPFFYIWDYLWLNDGMTYVAHYWRENGFQLLPIEFMHSNKNPVLTAYMALLFYLGGNDHFLNIVVLNAIHAVFVAILVAATACVFNGVKTGRKILVIGLFQPFGFGSSIYWRDCVGQLFVIISIICATQVKLSLKGTVLTVATGALVFLHRTVYLFNSLAAYCVQYVLFYQRKNSLVSIYKATLLMGFCLAVVFFYYGEQLVEISRIQCYTASGSIVDVKSSQNLFGYVHSILVGIIGPFPWYQAWDRSIPGHEYLLFDGLQASYCMVVIITLFQHYKRNALIAQHIGILISVALYILSGLLTYGHVSYVSVSTVLLLSLIRDITVTSFMKTWLFVLMMYVVFNYIWYLVN